MISPSWFDERPKPSVRLGLAVVGEVAGEDQRVDRDVGCRYPVEPGFEVGEGVDVTANHVSRTDKMGVGEVNCGEIRTIHDVGRSCVACSRAAVSVAEASAH